MVRRTLIEERMLADALPGYVGYMQRVRSRIVPGVW
jgi:protein-S-isoprenylcysteine O-methyltransferase Ste14